MHTVVSVSCFTVDVNLDHLAEVVFIRFLHCNGTEGTVCSPYVSRSHAVPLWEESVYISYSEFFCMRDWSLLCVCMHAWVYVCQYGCLFYSLDYNLIFISLLRLLQLWPWKLFQLATVSLPYTPTIALLLFLSTFLISGTTKCSCTFCIFPAPVLESMIFPRSPGCFYWRLLLGTKICYAHCYWDVLLLGSFSGKRKKICHV